MKTSKSIFFVVLLVVLIGAIIWFRQPTAEKVVRIGYLNSLRGVLPAEMMKQSGLLEQAAVNYDLVSFASSNTAYESLVRGDIDVLVGVSLLPLFLNENKQPGLVKLFLVDQFNEQSKFDHILVKNESAIKSDADLAGKKIGVFPGTTHTTFIKAFLKAKNIESNKIEFVQLPAASQLPALESGSVDALGLYEPNATMALATGKYRSLENSIYAKVYPNIPLAGSAINSNFVNNNPAVAQTVMNAVNSAKSLILSQPTKTYDALAAAMNMDLEVAKKIPLPTYADEVKKDELQSFIEFLVRTKELPASIDSSSFLLAK